MGKIKDLSVSTLAVEWIEIKFFVKYWNICGGVSTLAVEWIEISPSDGVATLKVVSTLAVEWIEI